MTDSTNTAPAPPWPLKSRDGVEFGPEGVTFEITRQVEGEDKIVPFTLFETLVGLNLTPNASSGKSQAEVFASRAIGAGFSSEAEILERFPQYKPRQNSETQEWFSTARRQIDIWSAEADERSAVKAQATMEAKGATMSVAQKANAIRLAGLLREHDGHRLAKELLDLTQHPEEIEDERTGEFIPKPMGGRLSRTIQRAESWLALVVPKEYTPPADQPTNTAPDPTGDEMVGDRVDEGDLTGLEGMSAEEIVEIYNAFCNDDPF